jgi:DNA-binding transcriptional LysR family regulator
MAKTVDWESRIGRRLRLRDLHIFFAVVQSGSMAKAAARLRVTQPAVSKAISDLEAALGVRLFDSSTQGVEPTMYGGALLKCGAAVFDELRQGIRNIEFLADPAAGELKIGCPESVAAFLSSVIDSFSRQYPRVVLDVEDVNSPAAAPKLRDRTLDIVLGRLRALPNEQALEDMNVETLLDDELVVAAGTGSRWARRRKIDLAELINERWILTAPDAWNQKHVAEAFQSLGLDLPQISVRTFSVHLRTNLLATGSFITVLPRSVLRLDANLHLLKILPIKLPGLHWPIAIVTLKKRTLSPVVEHFIKCARDVAKSTQRVISEANSE